MPERVVHVLEIIEIEEKYGKRLARRRTSRSEINMRRKECPVGQTGQHIVIGQMLQTFFALLFRGDVGIGTDSAAIGEAPF